MAKFFIVIDMQNDFVTGSLANPAAEAIVGNIAKSLKRARAEGENIIFTRDTHNENYLETTEGKHLPVVHCVKGTPGWEIVPELMKETDENTIFIDKTHFGFDGWRKYIKEGDEVTICGTVTSICVCANFSAIKQIEGVEVKYLVDCCADLSDFGQEAAFRVMDAQQGIKCKYI